MFKFIMVLDCDSCEEPFSLAAVCCERNMKALEMTIERIMLNARQRHNWLFTGPYSICGRCVESEEKMAEWLQSEAERNQRLKQ